MKIHKFIVPHGCDLKLDLDGVFANIRITHEKATVCRLTDTFLLGEKISFRRGVYGVTLVIDSPGEREYVDWRREIPNLLERKIRRDEEDARLRAELARNLDHLRVDGTSGLPSFAQEIARNSFRATRERMSRGREFEEDLRRMSTTGHITIPPMPEGFVSPSGDYDGDTLTQVFYRMSETESMGTVTGRTTDINGGLTPGTYSIGMDMANEIRPNSTLYRRTEHFFTPSIDTED